MYNAGNGGRITLNQAWALLQQLEGVTIPHTTETQAGDVRDSQADTTLAVRDLGHAPRYSFEEGMRITLEWPISRAGSSPDQSVGGIRPDLIGIWQTWGSTPLRRTLMAASRGSTASTFSNYTRLLDSYSRCAT